MEENRYPSFAVSVMEAVYVFPDWKVPDTLEPLQVQDIFPVYESEADTEVCIAAPAFGAVMRKEERSETVISFFAAVVLPDSEAAEVSDSEEEADTFS